MLSLTAVYSPQQNERPREASGPDLYCYLNHLVSRTHFNPSGHVDVDFSLTALWLPEGTWHSIFNLQLSDGPLQKLRRWFVQSPLTFSPCTTTINHADFPPREGGSIQLVARNSADLRLLLILMQCS